MSQKIEVDPENKVVRTQRSIRKSGNSIVVALPPQILEGAGLEVGDDVELVADMAGGGLSIRPVESQPDEPASDEDDSNEDG